MRRTLRNVAFVAMLAAVGLANAGAPPASTALAAGPEHVRGVEQTLLTYPEWFLVFSPNEYGEFIGRGAPSEFPFYGHIGQFWESYRSVFEETRRRELGLNAGYHLMIIVIGISTTVEYAVKSAYEMLVGKLAETFASEPTAEERYAAAVAQEYVRFIRVLPWYEYDFGRKLRGLWRDTPLDGAGLLRKWERKFALTSEYLIKMGYAKLIKAGTKSIYEQPLPVTAVLMEPAPMPDSSLPDLKILRSLPEGAALATVPRYEAFTNYAQALADQGVDFREIAGNQSIILVSVLATSEWKPVSPATALLVQPILTRPGTRRVVMVMPVAHLATALREWKTAKLQVEHVFDY